MGLTGNLGAGKSTVAELFGRWGARVVEADEQARDVVAPGTPAFAEIEGWLGPAVVTAEGGLDRAALRRLVFADPEARRRLEGIVHPRVRERLGALAAEARAAGTRVFVASIPLLFEAGMPGEFDAIVLVDAPEEVRLRRVVAAGRMSEAEARAVAGTQEPASEKRARADFVIDNDGDLPRLERRAWEVWKALVRLADSSP